MSTLNAPSTSSSINAKTSRFSTLKVFGKFGGNSAKGKGIGDDGLKPPPLPPKDPYYLMSNRSLASLSPESIPGSPMTPPSAAISSLSNPASNNQNLLQIQYARRQGTGQLHPGSSSLSLASSATSAVDTPSDGIASSPSQQMEGEQLQGQIQKQKQAQRKKSGFFKFRRGTKSPSIRSASGDESMLSPEGSGEDENISLPWNFQHNIHVDEAYGGMPPSWTISLAEAGFTEDEIAAIYARKQAGTLGTAAASFVSPSLQYLYTDRPRSPAAMSSISLTSSTAASTTVGNGQPVPKTSLSTSSSTVSVNNMNGPAPVLARPTPRSTSLPRQYSDASLRSNPSSAPIPQLPTPLNPFIGKKIITTPGLPSHPQPRKRTNSSSSSSLALSISVDGSDARMRPNAVAEQGDGPVNQATQPQHSRDTSAGSGGITLPGGHRSNGSLGLTQGQKSSPLSTRPPISLDGSPVNSSNSSGSASVPGAAGASRPSTPPRRTYHVVNTQSPPPPYTGNGDALYGPNGYPLEKKGSSDATPTTARQGQNQRRTSTSLERDKSMRMYNPHSPGPSTPPSQNSKRNSRRRSKRIFPSSVGGSVSSLSSSANPLAHTTSASSSSPHSPSGSPSSSPKLNRSATVSSSHSGHSQHSTRGRTPVRNDSGSSVRSNKKLSLPQVDLKLDGLGFGSLGLDLDLGLDDWGESVIKEATPTTPEFSEITRNVSGSGASGSSLPRIREEKYLPKPLYGSNASSLGSSSARPPPPTRAVPPVVDSASTSSISPPPSSFSLQFSPVITVESGESPSISVQSLSEPLASPTSPFPRSPSPGTGMSDRMSAPMATPSSSGLSPSPHAGLFDEIRDMLAPGAMTGGPSSGTGRRRQKKPTRREKDKSPIRRIRGDDYEDEEDEENQNDEGGDEEWEEGQDNDRYSAPALSESHSPILPVSPQSHQQHRVSNRVSAYRVQDREKMQQAVRKGAQAQVADQADARTQEEVQEDMVEDEEAGDDGLLTADGGRYSSNRNSSRSSTSTVSTVTVTHLTATSTIVKRAVATKIGVPGSGRSADDTAPLHASGSTPSPAPSRSSTPLSAVEPVSATPPASTSPSPAPSRPPSRPHSRLHALPPPLPPPSMPPSPPPVGLLSSPPLADLAAPVAVNGNIRSKSPVSSLKHPASPQSSHFGGSEEDSASASTSTGGSASGSISLSTTSRASSATSTSTSPTADANDDETELVYYLESPLPGQTKFNTDRKISNLHEHHHLLTSTSDTFGGVYKEDLRTPSDEDEEQEDEEMSVTSPTASPHESVGASGVFRSPTLGSGYPVPVPAPPGSQASTSRPTIVISSSPVKPGPITAALASVTPSTPVPRYRGWLSEVVKPLEEFIDEPIDPREYYLDLQEIAEGESGSVYAARVSETADLNKLKLSSTVKAQDVKNQADDVTALVAIKSVAILPSGSTKLDELSKELVLLKGLMHSNVLGMDALYVDLVEDSLWIRMELMERSLADVVGLYEEGLILQERVIARFTSDMLEALQYLRANNIAHRDVRSDNLLLNNLGILKLADFSNAVRVTKSSPIVHDPVGVLYWQAPEMRSGPYNALKVDVWSVGATVWEMAQAEPPFANSSESGERWPPLNKPEIYSPAFHEFLRLCSEPPSTRPDPKELAENSFVSNSCGRPVIVQLLQQCTAIEKLIQQREESEEADS